MIKHHMRLLRASVSLPAMASVYVAYGVLRRVEKERADAGN